MCNNTCDCKDGNCRAVITVENDYAPCTFPEKFFDIDIRSIDGDTIVLGKVSGSGSAVFDLPCDKEYTVTVIGNENSSPRAQTRRIKCFCGETSGLTFIFGNYEPECGGEEAREEEPMFSPPAVTD